MAPPIPTRKCRSSRLFSNKSQYLREKKIQVFACFIGPQESAKVNSVFTEWKKNIELFKSRSALFRPRFRPVCPKFENANFWGKNLVKLEIGPLEKILRGVEKEEVGRN